MKAAEGSVYKIDLRDGKPAHYWIILHDPQIVDGRFLTVSLTDRHNLDPVSDVWEFNYSICPALKLSKPSIVALRYVLVKTQSWLDEKDAEFICTCNAATLKRARCNLLWYPRFLSSDANRLVQFYTNSWDPCGSAPPNKP